MNASEQVTKHIHDLADWRGKLLEQLRKLIRDAAPDAIEDWKWKTPVCFSAGAGGARHVILSFVLPAITEMCETRNGTLQRGSPTPLSR